MTVKAPSRSRTSSSRSRAGGSWTASRLAGATRAEFLCLLGPNGGGKTTLLKAVLGLAAPRAGRILVLGEPPEKARRRVGYLPQRKGFARGLPGHARPI